MFGWVVLFFLEFAAARQGVEGLAGLSPTSDSSAASRRSMPDLRYSGSLLSRSISR